MQLEIALSFGASVCGSCMCGRKEKEMEGDIKGEKERASVGLTFGFEVMNFRVLRSLRTRLSQLRSRTKFFS